MAILKLGFLLVVALLAACGLVRDPAAFEEGEDRVTVQAVLVAGEQEARVLLTLAPARTDPYRPIFLDPVPGAAVRVVVGEDTATLRASGGAATNPCFGNEPTSPGTPAGHLAAGCYHGLLRHPIAEGREYELLLTLPGVGEVHGSTVIPFAPRFIRPEAGGTLSAAPATVTPVAWSGAGELRTELALRPQNRACTIYIDQGLAGEPGYWSVAVTGKSETAVRVWPQCPGAPAGAVPAALVLSVFDTAYTRFAARAFGAVNPELGEARAGITGPAIGYFAGAASALQPVIVR
jgi:hypothetical protein